MTEFEVIDIHTHLARTSEEENNSWLFHGRRTCDRYGTPKRAVEYMERSCISRMAFMTLVPRQDRGPLFEKANLDAFPKNKRAQELKRIGEQISPKIREMNEWGCEVGRRFPQLLPFSCISPDLGGAREMVREIELCTSQGAKGIKLRPGIFCFFPDDEVM